MANSKLFDDLEHSESGYIINDILPILQDTYGYPRNDKESVRVNSVPIYNASGNKTGENMDIVFYHDDEPVLLIEAKRKWKTHEKALAQAIEYITRFPKHKPRFAASGKAPKFFATTVGTDIKFYRKLWNADYEEFEGEQISIQTWTELLEQYGLSPKYKPKILEPESFKFNFFDELVTTFKIDKQRINRETILTTTKQILAFLKYSNEFTEHVPYVDLEPMKKHAVRQLFNQFDLKASLSPILAKEFRNCILRSFQGTQLNQYLTEQCVIEFMVRLLDGIPENPKVLDFECGSGGFLAETISHWKLDLQNINGVDIDELPFAVSKTFLAIYFGITGRKKIEDIPIENENGLFKYGSESFDLIIGNPAGSWKYEHGDEEKIIKQGLPRLNTGAKYFSEYDLSVKQALRSSKVGAKICLILPEGVFSNSSDHYLRRLLDYHGTAKAIVSLPKGVFYKGTDTYSHKAGKQQSSQKMSILYYVKDREMNWDFLQEDEPKNRYKVFMASITDNHKWREIKDWLTPRLDVVFEQWLNWNKKGKLKDLPPIELKYVAAVETEAPFKHPELFDVPEEEEKHKKKKPKTKSDSKVDEGLEELFD